MRKIFLTGPVQIGKSTVVDRVLEQLRLSVGGIRTARTSLDPSEMQVELVDCMTDARFDLAWRGPAGVQVNLEVFETAGADAVRRAVDRAGLILLDELGWMELPARRFQRQVFGALDSPKRVLGVVKPESNPFLDAVRMHPKVEVIRVTEENRDALASILTKMLAPW